MNDPEGYEAIADIEDDGEQVREVFARFGLAVYAGQVLEHGLANVLVLGEHTDGLLPSEPVYDARYEDLFRKTAGELVRQAGSARRVVADDLALCQRAIKARNRLVHDFFRDHSVNFTFAAGRQIMLDEADSIRDLLQQADAACSRVLTEIMKKVGIAPERLDELIRREAERLQQSAVAVGNEDA